VAGKSVTKVRCRNEKSGGGTSKATQRAKKDRQKIGPLDSAGRPLQGEDNREKLGEKG